MLFLYTSDLHSRLSHYKRLFELYKIHKPDVIIIGGDLFEYTHNKDDQICFLDNYLKSYFRSFTIPIVVLPGNTDWPFSIRRLKELNIENVHVINKNNSYNLRGFKLKGYEYITPPPFSQKHHVRRDLKEDSFPIGTNSYVTDNNGDVITVNENYFNSLSSVEEDINGLFTSDSIWIAHNPPYGCNLDIMYDNIHIGSKALLKEIKELQPKLILSGHVHESPVMSGK